MLDRCVNKEASKGTKKGAILTKFASALSSLLFKDFVGGSVHHRLMPKLSCIVTFEKEGCSSGGARGIDRWACHGSL